MKNVTSNILRRLGFKYDEFSDGYFWHFTPSDDFGKLKLANAMGFSDYDQYDPPDTVILQCDTDFKNWQYVCDGDYGNLSNEEALEIISLMNAGDCE